MAVASSEQVRTIQLACAPYARLFRANTGLAWTGDARKQADGSILIREPRPFKSGVVGMADLTGWRVVDGRYVALEVKSGSGRASKEQRAFIAAVLDGGGIAGVVWSVDEALALVRPEGQLTRP